MSDPRAGALLSSVARLLSEKKALAAREQEFVEGLNRVLNQMGYEVVTVASPRRNRGEKRRGRRRGGRSTARRGPGRQAKPARRGGKKARRARGRTRARTPKTK